MIPHVEFLVFVAVLGVCACAGLLYHARRARLRNVLRHRLGELQPETDSTPLQGATNEDDLTGLRRMLADSSLGWETKDFLSRATLASATGLLCGAFLRSVFLAAFFAIAGSLLVVAVVRRAQAKRLARCDAQMPQALEVMILALRAGHAMPNAIGIAAEEAPAPICDELQRVAHEHELGRPIPDALEAMGQRLPGCKTVTAFVIAVQVLKETGGNIIGVIDRIVQNARARAGYETRLRALTAEGRMSAKLLGSMPVLFALVAGAMDPMYAKIMLHDSTGRMLGLIAFAWWVLGIITTRKLLKTAA